MEQQNLENKNSNEFFAAMNSPAVTAKQSAGLNYSSHSTNSNAETIINIMATILLICGIIGGLAIIITGIESSSSYYYGKETAIVSIIGGIAIIVVSIIQWAFIKIFINISRNLFNINDFLRERFGDKE